MTQISLETKEELDWLFEAHPKRVPADFRTKTVCAFLEGPKKHPSRILLYASDEHMTAPFYIWPEPMTTEQRLSVTRQRYLGVLGLLCRLAPYALGLRNDDREDDRECIEQALEDACADGTLQWRRILDRYELEPVPGERSHG